MSTVHRTASTRLYHYKLKFILVHFNNLSWCIWKWMKSGYNNGIFDTPLRPESQTFFNIWCFWLHFWQPKMEAKIRAYFRELWQLGNFLIWVIKVIKLLDQSTRNQYWMHFPFFSDLTNDPLWCCDKIWIFLWTLGTFEGTWELGNFWKLII